MSRPLELILGIGQESTKLTEVDIDTEVEPTAGDDDDIGEIFDYAESGKLPHDDVKARRLTLEQAPFSVVDGTLYYVDPKHGHRKRAVVLKQL